MGRTRLTATHLDGRQYDNRYVFVFEFLDGRIAELREHVDTVYAARFFGSDGAQRPVGRFTKRPASGE